MKKIIILLLFLSAGKFSFSQKFGGDKKIDPDHWTFAVENSSADEATLVFKLKLDDNWHVYSQNTPEGGPLPMVYKFDATACYELSGKCLEPKPHEEFDSTFGVKVLIFDGEVTFRQKIKVKSKGCKIHGTIEYQICKDACIFKDTTFDIELKK